MKKAAVVFVILFAVTGMCIAQNLVPLQYDLPEAMFVGTPKTVKSDNLEPAMKGGTGKRPPLMVPKGVENVALDKAITSSDEMPVIGELELITDGDKEGADGSYVELGPMKQWVQIDLEESVELYAVIVWHFHSQARVYRDVVVQIADDADFTKNVRTVFNNDHDNSIGLGAGKDKEWIETRYGRPMPVKGEKAQFVRLYSNGSTSSEMNHYIEVEVYGK
ncbi:hypothetical protein BVX97_00525 [bacterium E08(2017)]|nr:hypothetical protein BVX97_00525 [bacterium E08(2017)]